MYLTEFQDYKNQFLDDLLSNEELVRLLDDKYELHPEETDEEKMKRLWLTQIFPYEYLPETAEHGLTYICFDVDISRMSDRREAPSNKMIYSPVLYVWVFTHKSMLWLPEGGVRTDRICMEIANTVNGSHHYGMGTIELYSVKRFAPTMDFQGKVMTFDATDWNHTRPTGRTWPSNRALGV